MIKSKIFIICLVLCNLLISCSEQDVYDKQIEIQKNNSNNLNSSTVLSRTVSVGGVEKSYSRESIKAFSISNTSEMDALVKYDVNAYRIVYKTLDCKGDTIEASGSLLIPQKVNSTDVFPILAYQHGTKYSDNEVYDNSINEFPFLAASTGYITIFTDYLGYNASGSMQHPYFYNKISDLTVRDMIVSSLPKLNTLGASHNGNLSLYGFSEGANVTVSFLKSIEEDPINGLTIKSTAACSGAYNLTGQIMYSLANSNQSTYAMIASYYVYGFEKNVARTGALNLVFNNPFLTYINNGIFQGNYSIDGAAAWFNYGLASGYSVFKTSFLSSVASGTNTGFINFTNSNTLTNLNWCPKSKIKLFHGKADLEVNSNHSYALKNMFDTYNNTGTNNIEYGPIDNVGHNESIMITKSLIWLNNNR